MVSQGSRQAEAGVEYISQSTFGKFLLCAKLCRYSGGQDRRVPAQRVSIPLSGSRLWRRLGSALKPREVQISLERQPEVIKGFKLESNIFE